MDGSCVDGWECDHRLRDPVLLQFGCIVDDVRGWDVDVDDGDGDRIDERNRLHIPSCVDEREGNWFVFDGVSKRDACDDARSSDVGFRHGRQCSSFADVDCSCVDGWECDHGLCDPVFVQFRCVVDDVR